MQEIKRIATVKQLRASGDSQHTIASGWYGTAVAAMPSRPW
jgi:hypothetical protein